MTVGKSNLVAMLLEVGEENAAVLLARSDLPDEIDLQRDLDALMLFGLDGDQVNGAIGWTLLRSRKRLHKEKPCWQSILHFFLIGLMLKFGSFTDMPFN